MVSLSVKVDAGSLSALGKQMERSRKELGKSRVDAMGQAAWYISRSLAASTMTSPKLRRIVRNPDKRWKTDHRRAPYGVMAPKGKERTLTFKPIYRTGEFGKIRYFDKKTMSWFRHSTAKKGQWEHIPSGQVEGLSADAVVPGIMSDRRRKIGRRGLGKKSWMGLQKRARHGGVVSVAGSGNVGSATWSPLKTTLTLRNELRYMRKALIGGDAAINKAIARAAGAMRGAIDKRLKELGKA
jgi:hypothetical protein